MNVYLIFNFIVFLDTCSIFHLHAHSAIWNYFKCIQYKQSTINFVCCKENGMRFTFKLYLLNIWLIIHVVQKCQQFFYDIGVMKLFHSMDHIIVFFSCKKLHIYSTKLTRDLNKERSLQSSGFVRNIHAISSHSYKDILLS